MLSLSWGGFHSSAKLPVITKAQQGLAQTYRTRPLRAALSLSFSSSFEECPGPYRTLEQSGSKSNDWLD